ncbi:hypothetical protein M8C21_023071 [Ambrosia artemisiifolia]|uniref:Uncharacterized protein n=1 Tax=Ambrosia artemisiifolia TaxID=4212 RepID=A0AAD5BXG7_AMBAR|nr:hypothetical protein M8C21_023071 [Ambrosia artemisiifolia]
MCSSPGSQAQGYLKMIELLCLPIDHERMFVLFSLSLVYACMTRLCERAKMVGPMHFDSYHSAVMMTICWFSDYRVMMTFCEFSLYLFDFPYLIMQVLKSFLFADRTDFFYYQFRKPPNSSSNSGS